MFWFIKEQPKVLPVDCIIEGIGNASLVKLSHRGYEVEFGDL
jgi:hypothetical protein